MVRKSKDAAPVAQNWAEFSLSTPSGCCDPLKLRGFLQGNVKNAVRLSGAGLQKLDSLLLQSIIAATKSWSGRGLGFELVDLPAAVEPGLALLGIRPEMISWKIA